MDPEVFDQFLMRAVTLAIEKNEEMFRCPNPACGSVVERVQAVDSPAHVRMAVRFFLHEFSSPPSTHNHPVRK